MSEINLLCRNATTFGANGIGIDEDAFRQHLHRFIESRLGLYVGSAGSGESHAMTREELATIYRIAVQEGKGKITVNANPPEQHTAAMTLEHSLLAAEAGVGIVNIYGPSSWHGFKPTDEEILAFYDDVFRQFPYPAAIAPNPIIGYTPSAELCAALCAKHHQIVAINLAGLAGSYFVRLKDVLPRDVDIFVPYQTALETLSLGARGLLGAEANIVPKTFRAYIDRYEAGDVAGAARVYAQLQKLTDYLKPWHRSSPKWIKMYLKVFGLPGGAGGLREPYRMPGDEELERFAQGLVALDIPEVNEHARQAGRR